MSQVMVTADQVLKTGNRHANHQALETFRRYLNTRLRELLCGCLVESKQDLVLEKLNEAYAEFVEPLPDPGIDR